MMGFPYINWVKNLLAKCLRQSPGLAVILLGVFGALVTFGVYYPSEDDMAIVPFLYRWEDPRLFMNDIVFGAGSQRFLFGLFILHGLSKIMPLPFATGLWIVCSHAFLFFGLWLIFKVLAEKGEVNKGIIVLFCLLMISGQDAIIGEYHLQYHFWAPHYLAHPLVFMALFFLANRRYWIMLVLLVAASCVHILIGLQGTVLCVGVLVIEWIGKLPKRQRIYVFLGIFLGMVSVILGIRSLDFSYVRISSFLRAPWHMVPLISHVALRKYVIVAIGFMLMGETFYRANTKSQPIYAAGLIAISGILFALWNNTTFAIPALVMANPLEYGPTLHGLFLCLAALLIIRITQSNRPYLIVLPLLAPHKIGFYFIISMLAFYQIVENKVADKNGKLSSWIAICTFVLSVSGSWLLFPDSPSSWRSGIHYSCALVSAMGVIVLLHYVKPKSYSGSVAVIVPAGVIMLLLIYGLLGGDIFWKINLSLPPAEKTLIETTNFIEKHTQENSLIVHPPVITNFQYLSHRSSFVSFKAVPLTSSLLPEWFHRLQYLGVFSALIDYRSLTKSVIADCENYYDLSTADFLNLAAKFPDINYIVLDKRRGNFPLLKILYENADYQVCIPEEQKIRLLAENRFSIDLFENPVSCEELLENGTDRYGWVNRGSRGTILIRTAGDDIRTLQLIAGAPDPKGTQTLLLSPKAESEKGFPIVSKGNGVVFSCDIRLSEKRKIGGTVQLRLDVFSSLGGWSYHSRRINVSEKWRHFEASASLASDALSVYPTLIWDPASEGCVLEMRDPRLRWLTLLKSDQSIKSTNSGMREKQPG